ncbi:hypothetical protein LSH36_129g02045 [Paralvinella palmiformis]|uniref:Uncharacterized protein n=1 Tax=Paralvinella palmiformis TaxID=53620 RepID=A0AAD9JXB8_9ANNE|nr:hypothetical protein LSH36_129g02045 [Paralvinella palmiformis]
MPRTDLFTTKPGASKIIPRPVFLPDPKDGSLYTFGQGIDGLKKLPFTIPELVTASPCRSSDGTLYTGFKKDIWYAVDPITGLKTQTLTMEGTQNVCPSSGGQSIFIGRTEYTIVMFDSKTKTRLWNATFTDYSSHLAPGQPELCSDGVMVTMDIADGSIKWSQDFKAPVVAMYFLDAEGLKKIPYMSMAPGTLEHLTGQLASQEWRDRFHKQGNHQEVFYPTLYVGQYDDNLYALPTLVDEQAVTITAKQQGMLLLEGPDKPKLPKPPQHKLKPGQHTESVNAVTVRRGGGILLLGFHEIPEQVNSIIDKSRQITDASSKVIILDTSHSDSNKTRSEEIQRNTFPGSVITHMMTAVVGVCIVLLVWKKLGKKSAILVNSVSSSEQEASKCTVVGKITFNTKEVLGHGCKGTFVYKYGV